MALGQLEDHTKDADQKNVSVQQYSRGKNYGTQHREHTESGPQ